MVLDTMCISCFGLPTALPVVWRRRLHSGGQRALPTPGTALLGPASHSLPRLGSSQDVLFMAAPSVWGFNGGCSPPHSATCSAGPCQVPSSTPDGTWPAPRLPGECFLRSQVRLPFLLCFEGTPMVPPDSFSLPRAPPWVHLEHCRALLTLISAPNHPWLPGASVACFMSLGVAVDSLRAGPGLSTALQPSPVSSFSHKTLAPVSFNASLSITQKWRLTKGFVKLGISSMWTMYPKVAGSERVL